MQFVSVDFNCQMFKCLGDVLGVLDCIWMVSLDVYCVRMRLRGYLGSHLLRSGEFTPF